MLLCSLPGFAIAAQMEALCVAASAEQLMEQVSRVSHAGSVAGRAEEPPESSGGSRAAEHGRGQTEGAVVPHTPALLFSLSHEATSKIRTAPGSSRWNSLGMAPPSINLATTPCTSSATACASGSAFSGRPDPVGCTGPGRLLNSKPLLPRPRATRLLNPCSLLHALLVCILYAPLPCALSAGSLPGCCLPSHVPRQSFAQPWPACLEARSGQVREPPTRRTTLALVVGGQRGRCSAECSFWRHPAGERCPLRPLVGLLCALFPASAAALVAALFLAVLAWMPAVAWMPALSCCAEPGQTSGILHPKDEPEPVAQCVLAHQGLQSVLVTVSCNPSHNLMASPRYAFGPVVFAPPPHPELSFKNAPNHWRYWSSGCV